MTFRWRQEKTDLPRHKRRKQRWLAGFSGLPWYNQSFLRDFEDTVCKEAQFYIPNFRPYWTQDIATEADDARRDAMLHSARVAKITTKVPAKISNFSHENYCLV